MAGWGKGKRFRADARRGMGAGAGTLGALATAGQQRHLAVVDPCLPTTGLVPAGSFPRSRPGGEPAPVMASEGRQAGDAERPAGKPSVA